MSRNFTTDNVRLDDVPFCRKSYQETVSTHCSSIKIYKEKISRLIVTQIFMGRPATTSDREYTDFILNNIICLFLSAGASTQYLAHARKVLLYQPLRELLPMSLNNLCCPHCFSTLLRKFQVLSSEDEVLLSF